MKPTKKILSTLALLVTATFQLPAYAIDTDPLDFVAPAPGKSVLGLYYGDWSSSKQYTGGSQSAANTVKLRYGTGTYVKFHDVGGYVVGTKIVVPVLERTVTTPAGATSSGSGVGDPTLVVPVWLVNKPETRTYFGIASRLQLPIGQYDKNNISAGANRYTFVVQPGLSTGLTENLTLDLVGDAQYFGKNDDIVGGGSLEKKPLYSLQTHLTYQLGPGVNASIGAYKYVGGETTTRGIRNNDRTDTTTIIGSLGYWVTKADNVTVQYRTDTSVENGAKFNGLQLRLVHVF